MRIDEIIADPTPTMGTWYHATRHIRLKSILATGLRPSRRRQWKNKLGGRLGETGMVYLMSTMDAAIHFAAKLEWELKDAKKNDVQIDIITVQGEIPVQQDPHIESQMNGNTWFMTPMHIPPEMIKQVTPLTLQMTRDYIARRDGRPTDAELAAQEAEPQQPASRFTAASRDDALAAKQT